MKAGTLITFYEYINNQKKLYKYLQYGNKLISTQLPIPIGNHIGDDYIFVDPRFKIIDYYPINYWEHVSTRTVFYLSDVIYLDQIRQNTRKRKNDFPSFAYRSKFMDWRGMNYKIYLNTNIIGEQILVVYMQHNPILCQLE
jgi:hypothetical protein